MKVHFINYRKEGVDFLPIVGNSFRIRLGPTKCWNRDPHEGTFGTAVLGINEAPPPLRPQPKWIKKTSIVWEDCPENCDFAPYRTVSFHDGNIVKLRKRRSWVPPEMKGLVVEFLLRSKTLKVQILNDANFGTTRILTGIPARRVVFIDSKYAKFHKWVFLEGGAGHGEKMRSKKELEQIEKKKEELMLREVKARKELGEAMRDVAITRPNRVHRVGDLHPLDR